MTRISQYFHGVKAIMIEPESHSIASGESPSHVQTLRMVIITDEAVITGTLFSDAVLVPAPLLLGSDHRNPPPPAAPTTSAKEDAAELAGVWDNPPHR